MILSGMGSDGTLGLRAIKEKAGAAFVQALDVGEVRRHAAQRDRCRAGRRRRAGRGAARRRSSPTAQHAPLHRRAGRCRSRTRRRARWRRSFVLLRAQTGNDFSLYKRSTIYRRIERRMGLHQIDNDRELRPLPAREPARDRAAVQGAADRRDELLPRSAGLGAPARRRSLPALLGARGRPASLRAWVPGLLDRRGGLLAGHGVHGGDRAAQAGEEPRACRSSPPTSTGTRSTRRARASTRQHRRRRLARAAAPVLRAGGARLPRRQGDPRDGGVRAAERHHGPAVHQARHPVVPQPAHLPVAGAAEEADPALSLQPEPGRRPVPRQRRDGRRVHRAVRARRRQDADLSAASSQSVDDRADRVSRTPS